MDNMKNMTNIKTRFAPSPTGSLHVGGARTALFNYCLARKLGGKFLLRIEDTDQARHDEGMVDLIVKDLRWLGIEWDEGFGKDHDPAGIGPFRQSERLGIYKTHIKKLLDEGKAYYAFDTAEELDVLREAAKAEKQDFRYERPATFPTEDQADAARAAGKPVVVRFACPVEDVTVHDEVFGDVLVTADQMDDFIIVKADGWPTYHLANVIDDALMGINLICRGQEFLKQSSRHIVLREAFGFPAPKYVHLPLIMDMQGKKLSKRDGDVEVDLFRVAGYLPEAMVNFIALLGWSPGGDREKFTLPELVELFDVSGIGKSNPKFDRDKLLSFNTDAVATAGEARLLECFKEFLEEIPTHIPSDNDQILRHLLRANAGFRTFPDVLKKSDVLFAPNDSYPFDEKAVQKVLAKNDGEGYVVLRDILGQLAEVEWNADPLEEWLRSYCEQKELGMGKVAQPIRVAVTGTTISPPIFDALVILGKENTLARISRCLAEKQTSE